MAATKLCRNCGETKPTGDFYPQGNYYSAYCRECVKARSRAMAARGYFRERNRRNAERVGRAYGHHGLKIGDVAVTPFCEAMVNRARKRCARNGLAWELSTPWVRERVLAFAAAHYCVFEVKHPFAPSLDRLDNSVGYTMANTRVVWLIENYARNTFTDEQVIEFCKRKLNLL